MTDHSSQFVVTSLRPENSGGGSGGRIYQLNANSVSPTRVIGRDEDGFPIEETVPIMAYHRFVTSSGNVNRVTIRTAVPHSSEPSAQRYEQSVVTSKINAGWLPLEECPYTYKYKHITGTSLVKVPAGESDCGGSPEGCVHLQTVIESRLGRSRARHDRNQEKVTTMTTEAAEKMQRMTVEAFGQALAQHMPDTSKAKAAMQAGKDSK